MASMTTNSHSNMEDIHIYEKQEVPPLGGSSSGRPSKYPFDKLVEAGMSFTVPVSGDPALVLSLRNCCCYHNKKTGNEYKAEVLDDSIRVWRIS